MSGVPGAADPEGVAANSVPYTDRGFPGVRGLGVNALLVGSVGVDGVRKLKLAPVLFGFGLGSAISDR